MSFFNKLLVAAFVGVAAAAYNWGFNYIHDDQRGLLIFFSILPVLVYAMKR